MADKISGIDPNKDNPMHPGQNEAPPDPSNTSSIGQKVEQGVIDIKEGISEQSNAWEDVQERNIPDNTRVANSRSADYLKNPSPEEMNTDDEQLNSDE